MYSMKGCWLRVYPRFVGDLTGFRNLSGLCPTIYGYTRWLRPRTHPPFYLLQYPHEWHFHHPLAPATGNPLI